MPEFTAIEVADASLNFIRAAITHVAQLSDIVTTYAEVAAVTLGSQPAAAIAVPVSDADSQRVIYADGASGGTYGATGLCTHIALLDATNSRILRVVEVREPFACLVGTPIAPLSAPIPIIQPRAVG